MPTGNPMPEVLGPGCWLKGLGISIIVMGLIFWPAFGGVGFALALLIGGFCITRGEEEFFLFVVLAVFALFLNDKLVGCASTAEAAYGPLQVEIRVRGIDAPEWGAAGGPEAKEYAAKLVDGKRARLIYPDKGRIRGKYGRYLCFVELQQPDGSFLDFGEAMIRACHAKANEKYPSERHERYLKAANGCAP